jgi:hypothetical protein
MAQQTVVNTGGSPDSLKSGSDKINDNFDELYGVLTADVQAALAGNGGSPAAANTYVTEEGLDALIPSDTRDALAGTVGTPATGNEFVTTDDTRIRSESNAVTFLALPNECHSATGSTVYASAAVQSGSAPVLVKIFGRRVYVNRTITASKLLFYVQTVGGSGVGFAKFCLWQTDGTTKVAEWDWVNASTGAKTGTLGTATVIREGEYLLTYSFVFWNTYTSTVRTHSVDVNNWGPQLTGVAGNLCLFRSDQTISVSDESNPTESMPATLGTLSYTGSSLDETLPLIVIYAE